MKRSFLPCSFFHTCFKKKLSNLPTRFTDLTSLSSQAVYETKEGRKATSTQVVTGNRKSKRRLLSSAEAPSQISV